MSRIKILFSAITLAFLGLNAYADELDTYYYGVSYAQMIFSTKDHLSTAPTAIIGRFGKYLADNISLEGRLGFGITEDSYSIFGEKNTLKVKSVLGFYGIWRAYIGNTMSMYGLIGYSMGRGAVKDEDEDNYVTADSSDISYGVGADYLIKKDVSLNIEYINYIDRSDFDLSAFSLGVNWNFDISM